MANYLQVINAGRNFPYPFLSYSVHLVDSALRIIIIHLYLNFMKQSLQFVLIALSFSAMYSCTKNGDTKALNETKAKEFKAILDLKHFRLVDFYSDKPIDYVTTDTEVKSETDLRIYIKPYLLDDDNYFDNEGGVVITQNQQKKPGLSDPVLNRNYSVSSDENSVYLDFLDYDYNPIKYKLGEYSTGGFTIYLDWQGGAKVYSRFEKMN